MTSVVLPDTLHFLRALWRMNHALEKQSSAMHAALGVTAQQRMVIRGIGISPGISAGALADMLHLDPGTLSATLRRLERRRLIVRTRDRDDGRRVVLTLTAEGRTINRTTRGTVESAVARLLADASPAELRAGLRLITRFSTVLETPPATKPSRQRSAKG